jgi:hypothetical protein
MSDKIASLLYRLGIEGGEQARAEIASIGTEEEKTAARAIAAADAKARRVAEVERQWMALKLQSSEADDRALALMTGNTAQYEASKRREGFTARDVAETKKRAEREVAEAAAATARQEAELEVRTRALMSAIDPTWAAQQRFNAELRNAQALLDAGKIKADQYAAAVARAREGLQSAGGPAGPATNVQAIYQAGASTNYGGQSARESAAVFMAAAQAQEQLEQRTRAFLSAINPAYAAQQRYNQEMAEARSLISAGAISLDDYVEKLRQERAALQLSQQAHGRQLATVGELRAGSQQLSYQIGDVAQQFALGTPPMVIFAQQGGQVIQAIQLMRRESGGLIGFLAGPWGAALTGGIMLLGLLAQGHRGAAGAKGEHGKAAEALKGALERLEQMEAKNNHTTRQGILDTIAAANAERVRAQGVLRLTIATMEYNRQQAQRFRFEGGEGSRAAAAGMEVLAGINQGTISRLKADIADLDRKIAAGQAGIVLRDIAAGADKATGATQRYSDTLVDLQRKFERGGFGNPESEAAKAAFRNAGLRAAAERDAELEALRKKRDGTDRHAQSLQRQAGAMVVNAEASLELARAYMAGGDAAMRAEAARKGLTDATRRGIDGEAQVRRQLQVMIGEHLVQGAKALDQLRGDTAARAAVNAQVIAGTLAAQNMNRALSDEAVLRPLLRMRTAAQGEALRTLTEQVELYEQALKDAHSEEARSEALKSRDAALARVEDLKASILDLNLDPKLQAIRAARRAAEREAGERNFVGVERAGFIIAKMEEASADYALRRAQSHVRARRDQEDALTLANAELGLMRESDAVRGRELGLLRLSLQLRRDGLQATDADYQAIMRGAEAMELAGRVLARQHAEREAALRVQEDLIETVFDVRNFEDWGEAGTRIMNQMIDLAWQLAVINPMKNWATGGDLPTAGGVIAQLLGIGGAAAGGSVVGAAHEASAIPGFATGTMHWRGGMMLAGEHGPEIVAAPRGSQVMTANRTRELLGGGTGRQEVLVRVEAGPEFDARVERSSGGAAVRALEAAEPGIRQRAVADTFDTLERARMLPGR